jgi:hypothetical protein
MKELGNRRFREFGAFDTARPLPTSPAPVFGSAQQNYDHFNAGLRMIPDIKYLFDHSRFKFGLVLHPSDRTKQSTVSDCCVRGRALTSTQFGWITLVFFQKVRVSCVTPVLLTLS